MQTVDHTAKRHKTREEQAGSASASQRKAAGVLHGAAVIDALRASGLSYVLSVPDLFTSSGLLVPLAQSNDPPLLRLSREDEGIGIASALSYCDKRALLLIQYTGFHDSVNALRAVTLDYKLPLVMMIGLLGHDPEKAPRDSPRRGVRLVTPILDALEIPYHAIHDDSHVGLIKPAIERAYATATAVALLIARKPVFP